MATPESQKRALDAAEGVHERVVERLHKAIDRGVQVELHLSLADVAVLVACSCRYLQRQGRDVTVPGDH